MKKYYKVYAQCCVSAKPIKEITRSEAEDYFKECVDRNWEDFSYSIDNLEEMSDEDYNYLCEKKCNEYGENLEKILDEAGCIKCGDFDVVYDERENVRRAFSGDYEDLN